MRNTLLAIVALALPGLLAAQGSHDTYQPTFASLEKASPVPEWFKDAKIRHLLPLGRLLRAGVRQRMVSPDDVYRGIDREPAPSGNLRYVAEWPYDRFFTGGRDSRGAGCNSPRSSSRRAASSTRTSGRSCLPMPGPGSRAPWPKHHDGFSLWASKVNPWNAQDMGPHLDLVRLLTDAIRRPT